MSKIISMIMTLSVLFFFLGCQIDFQSSEKQKTKGWNVSGGKMEILTGNDAGLNPDLYPQIKMIASVEYKMMKENNNIPATGLYLVGIDYVPANINKILADESLTLKADGTLLNEEGSPVSVFKSFETFGVIPDLPKNNVSKSIYKSAANEDNFYCSIEYADYWDREGLKKYYKAYIKIWTYEYGNFDAPKEVEYIEVEVNVDESTHNEHCHNDDYLGTSQKVRDKGLKNAHRGYQYYYVKNSNFYAEKTYKFPYDW